MGLTPKSAAAGVCALLIICSPSFAQEPGGKTLKDFLTVPEVRTAITACAVDISKFCAGVKRGEGRIVRCLMANIDEVDPACTASMASAKTALGR
jgi:hypothetical protein